MQSPRPSRTTIFFCIITIFLTVCTTRATAQQNAYRNISITVLADQELLDNNAEGTKQEIKKIIAFAADIFQKEFGVTLELKTIRPWKFPYGKTELNADDALSDANLQAHDNEDSDITLGFTKKKLVLKAENKIAGYAFIGEDAAISRFDKFTALHEIGHLFGAHHSQDPTSIMYERYNTSEIFDDTNKAIIQKNIKEKFSVQNAP